jgi:hypothetical protein
MPFDRFSTLFSSNPVYREEPFCSNITRACETPGVEQKAEIRENFRDLFFRLMAGDIIQLVEDIERLLEWFNAALNDPQMQEIFYSNDVSQVYDSRFSRCLADCDLKSQKLSDRAIYEHRRERSNAAVAFAHMVSSPSMKSAALSNISLWFVLAHKFDDAIRVAKMIPVSPRQDQDIDNICSALLVHGCTNWGEIVALASRVADYDKRECLSIQFNYWKKQSSPFPLGQAKA